MATDDAPEETTVSDHGMVTIPAAVRRRLDIDPGDKLRWSIEDGELTVVVIREEYGVFEDAPTAKLGGDGLETHDLAGHEEHVEGRR